MKKTWIAVIVLMAVGVVVHDVWAAFLIEERLAGTLLSAGAGARPVEAVMALLFVALRSFGFPLALAMAAVGLVGALGSTSRAIRGRAARCFPTESRKSRCQ